MDQVKVDDLEVFPPAMVVLRGGAFVEMTSVEFTLLAELARQSGHVVERDALSRCVLGRTYSAADRSLDNHVSHICKKLGPAADGRRRIVSVRGKGYLYRRFQPVEIDQSAPKRTSKLQIAVDNAGVAEPVQPLAAQMSR
jgi:DNA-binding response OmpR family regulator